MLHDFSLAPDIHEDPTGVALDDRGQPLPDWRTVAFEILASTALHTDRGDPCDPVLTTCVVRFTAEGWLAMLSRALRGDACPSADCPATPRIEDHARAWLAEAFTPGPCSCAHDCCGHRHGWAEVRHLGGAIFVVAIQTTRNF
jgi:hypothetical protein